ncbi:DDE-type integrase/transposase/recombinase [Streptomyces sp. NBC_00045]|uniref:DDE-type integrase/transposase/recombinase n=1 Tax=Streptomyces sp. NBC_00045 TaxID=2975625 RepID=UPI003868812B
MTCLPTAEGWLYLATVIDLCTREIVGWSMADHMRTELVADAIWMAHAGGHTAGNAIFHSDRGTQYTSKSIPRSARRVGHPAEHRPGRLVLRQCRRGEPLRRPESRDRNDRLGNPGAGLAGRFPLDRGTLQPGRIHSTIGYITPYQERLRRHQRLDLAE